MKLALVIWLFLSICLVSVFLGIYYCISVFTKKSKIYYLVVTIYLLSGGAAVSLALRNIDENWWSFGVFIISYYASYLITNLLYFYRLKSIGGENTLMITLCKFSFWLLALLIIANNILIFMGSISGLVFSVFAILLYSISLTLEIYLNLQLIKLVQFMFEYRTRAKTAMVLKCKIYLSIVIALEFVFLPFKFLYPDICNIIDSIKVIGFIFRLYCVTNFYKDIITTFNIDGDNSNLILNQYEEDFRIDSQL
eukprot:NODE_1006_length_2716_cov_0.318303.p2 type:complete len:252 gc:universal NODE_1006_length_2716_cov_0.318303:136-891(+)